MTTADYLQNLVNDNKFFRELAQFYGEDISPSAGLAEIAKVLIHPEPTIQQSIAVDSTGKSLPVGVTSKVLLDKISGDTGAISTHKVAPYNVKPRSNVKILAGGAIIKQTKVDELSRFEVQIYDGKYIGKQLNTQFIEGDYQIAFTVTSTTTSINFGISGKKADSKMTFKLPAPGDYIYHFTTKMNADGTQHWYNMRITLPDGTPYIDEDGLVAAYIIPEEIKAISGYGEYNPANTEEYNYIDGSDGSYVIVGRKINGIWTPQNEERVYVAFNPWLTTNEADIIRIEGSNLATSSSILCRTYSEPKEKYTATLAFDLSSVIDGLNYATLYVNDQEYKEKITSASAIQLPIGAKVKVELSANYGYECTASIAPNNYSIDLAQEWNIFENVVITVTTTPIAVEKCAITINADNVSDFDYAYGSYRIPGSDEWVTILDEEKDYHLDNWETVYVPKGAEVFLEGNSISGSPIEVVFPNSFIITEDTVVYFVSEIQPEEEYELNIQINHNYLPSDVRQLTVKVNEKIVFNEQNSFGTTIVHNGT